MEIVNLTFSELLGVFLLFWILLYLVIGIFTGIMRIFESLWGEKIDRIFHYHYHYRDRRK